MSKPPLINLPDEERLFALLRDVFASGHLTNNGAAAVELEDRLREYLGVEHLVLTSSGTLALQIAYRALDLRGEVVTTPFSWVTTVSSLRWVGLNPVFVDIDAQTFNIDCSKIASAVTPRTSALLAVHTFGNPADIERIEDTAQRYGLRTIYDGAHCFGTSYRGRSVLAYGDASVLSLHATKLFHTVEGGAVVFRDRSTYERARLAINNGLSAAGHVHGLGINGRLSELHAAVGLCLLDDIDGILIRRRIAAERLRAQLTRYSSLQLQALNDQGQANHAYSPVVFTSTALRDAAWQALNAAGFAPRAYFDTPLNRAPFVDCDVRMPVAESIAERILCLPMRKDISAAEIDAMADVIAALCPAEATEPATLCDA
jgi:dTDP-4-amino-4,6-dideoxygalactose transaminase